MPPRRSLRRAGPPTATSVPRTLASTPRPEIARKPVAGASAALRLRAASTMARAGWCSDSASAAAAKASRPSSETLVAASPDSAWRPGQRAGLVEEHGVDVAHPLEGQAVFHQDAGPGRNGRRDADDEGDGEPEGMRAGDHEHGHRANEGGVEVAEGHQVTKVTAPAAVAT